MEKEQTIVFDKQEVGYNSPDYNHVLANAQFKDQILQEGYVVIGVKSEVLLVTRGQIGWAGGTLESRQKMQEDIDNNPRNFDRISLTPPELHPK